MSDKETFETTLAHGHHHLTIPVPFAPSWINESLEGTTGGCGQGHGGNVITRLEYDAEERCLRVSVTVADDTATLTITIGS
jgi:hypothetical protein